MSEGRVWCPGGRGRRRHHHEDASPWYGGRWTARCGACGRWTVLRRRFVDPGYEATVPPHKADPEDVDWGAVDRQT